MIVHLDLKPANILVSKGKGAGGQPSRFILADFGLARSMAEDGETIDRICGTKNYLTPELTERKFVGSFTDIFCLGLTLYEFATTDGTDQSDILVKRDLSKFKINEAYSPKLSAAILSMLDPDYRKRPTAEALLEMDWLNVASIDDSAGGRCDLFGNEFNESVIIKDDMNKKSISGVYGGDGKSLLGDLSLLN